MAFLTLHRSKLTENYAVTEIISKASCASHRSNFLKCFVWLGFFDCWGFVFIIIILLCNDEKQLRTWNAPVYSHQEQKQVSILIHCTHNHYPLWQICIQCSCKNLYWPLFLHESLCSVYLNNISRLQKPVLLRTGKAIIIHF